MPGSRIRKQFTHWCHALEWHASVDFPQSISHRFGRHARIAGRSRDELDKGRCVACERLIDVWRRRSLEILLTGVPHNADDGAGASAVELDLPTERVLAWEVRPCRCLVDDDRRCVGGPGTEHATALEGDAEHPEVVVRHARDPCPQTAILVGPPRKTHRSHRVSRQRHAGARRDRRYARQCADALQRLLHVRDPGLRQSVARTR